MSSLLDRYAVSFFRVVLYFCHVVSSLFLCCFVADLNYAVLICIAKYSPPLFHVFILRSISHFFGYADVNMIHSEAKGLRFRPLAVIFRQPQIYFYVIRGLCGQVFP